MGSGVDLFELRRSKSLMGYIIIQSTMDVACDCHERIRLDEIGINSVKIALHLIKSIVSSSLIWFLLEKMVRFMSYLDVYPPLTHLNFCIL